MSKIEDKLSHFPYEADSKQWEMIFNQSPIGIVFCDKQGNFLKVNQKFSEITEYNQAELYDKSYADITHPSDLSSDKKMIRKCLEREIPGYEMFKRYITKTGKVIWVRLTVWPIINDEDSVEYFIAHVQQLVNGDKTKLENKVVNRPTKYNISLTELIQSNFKTFLGICLILVSSFTGVGVAYWGAINQVATLKKEQDSQKELLFRLYELLSEKIDRE